MSTGIVDNVEFLDPVSLFMAVKDTLGGVNGSHFAYGIGNYGQAD